MLFRALNIQYIIIMLFYSGPAFSIVFIITTRIKYANFLAQLCLMELMIYPILELSVLLYFVKPYREFIRTKFNRLMNVIGLNRFQPAQIQPISRISLPINFVTVKEMRERPIFVQNGDNFRRVRNWLTAWTEWENFYNKNQCSNKRKKNWSKNFDISNMRKIQIFDQK